MHRSSESIARLACALAKAQIELVNPEKSLTAMIGPEGPGNEGKGKSFNYASLASGLDIVRKILGQHEIATVQTTAIDNAAGVVNLTTVLAHSSGEWIASDWPVCAINETATPHRMGAALTYARRYALFTLVGIAGEDDLDAPDLQNPRRQSSAPPQPSGTQNGHLNGCVAPHHRSRKGHSPPVVPLGTEESAALRDRLIAEISDLGFDDEAAAWAHRRIGEKNNLRTEDAQRVEEAFQKKLAAYASAASDKFEPKQAPPSGTPSGAVAAQAHAPVMQPTGREPRPRRLQTRSGSKKIERTKSGRMQGSDKSAQTAANPSPAKQRSASNGIDKTVLAFPEARRIRDRDHVRYVVQQPCLVCGRAPCEAHHLRFTQSRALGRKVSDEFTVPLCRGHHREVHRHGDEATWWSKLSIDPTVTARTLWLDTHPLPFDQNRTQPLTKRGGEKKADDQRTKFAVSNANRRGRKRDRVVSKTGAIDETKPFAGAPTP